MGKANGKCKQPDTELDVDHELPSVADDDSTEVVRKVRLGRRGKRRVSKENWRRSRPNVTLCSIVWRGLRPSSRMHAAVPPRNSRIFATLPPSTQSNLCCL